MWSGFPGPAVNGTAEEIHGVQAEIRGLNGPLQSDVRASRSQRFGNASRWHIGFRCGRSLGVRFLFASGTVWHPAL